MRFPKISKKRMILTIGLVVAGLAASVAVASAAAPIISDKTTPPANHSTGLCIDCHVVTPTEVVTPPPVVVVPDGSNGTSGTVDPSDDTSDAVHPDDNDCVDDRADDTTYEADEADCNDDDADKPRMTPAEKAAHKAADQAEDAADDAEDAAEEAAEHETVDTHAEERGSRDGHGADDSSDSDD